MVTCSKCGRPSDRGAIALCRECSGLPAKDDKKKASKKKGKTKTVNILDAPIALAGVSIGDETTKIGFSIDRADIDLETAESLFCGKRCIGRIVVMKGGDDPDQQALPGCGDIKHELKGTFDVKAFRVTPKVISSGAVFLLNSIDVEQLGHVAKKKGRLIISAVEEAANEDSDTETD